MSCADCKRFEQKLAFHTAPSLLGIKAASLVSFKKSEFDIPANASRFNDRAKAKELKIRMLHECGERVLILVYNERLLQKRLQDSAAAEILNSCGYSDLSLEACLDRLSERIGADGGFPHEIGIFLDYPVEDVAGFIENNGDNFKLCGYWKVYGNAERAQRTFDNYNKCRRFLCRRLSEGADIYQALKIPC